MLIGLPKVPLYYLESENELPDHEYLQILGIEPIKILMPGVGCIKSKSGKFSVVAPIKKP